MYTSLNTTLATFNTTIGLLGKGTNYPVRFAAELKSADSNAGPGLVYHRIAVDVMCALHGFERKRIVLNLQNRGAISWLAPEDVVEVPCIVDQSGAWCSEVGTIPEHLAGVSKAPCRNLLFERIGHRREIVLRQPKFAIEGSGDQAGA
jgi:hypothetical protein